LMLSLDILFRAPLLREIARTIFALSPELARSETDGENVENFVAMGFFSPSVRYWTSVFHHDRAVTGAGGLSQSATHSVDFVFVSTLHRDFVGTVELSLSHDNCGKHTRSKSPTRASIVAKIAAVGVRLWWRGMASTKEASREKQRQNVLWVKQRNPLHINISRASFHLLDWRSPRTWNRCDVMKFCVNSLLL
jgi:hypothetical protein